jgi:copper chaperone CopZ
MARQTFSVPNISCDHCVHTIRNELKEVGGLNLMDGDVENRKIREKLKEINYPAE